MLKSLWKKHRVSGGLIYVGEDMVQWRDIVNTAEHNETFDFTKCGELLTDESLFNFLKGAVLGLQGDGNVLAQNKWDGNVEIFWIRVNFVT